VLFFVRLVFVILVSYELPFSTQQIDMQRNVFGVRGLTRSEENLVQYDACVGQDYFLQHGFQSGDRASFCSSNVSTDTAGRDRLGYWLTC